MKVIYMGTPDFALKPLEMIAASHHQIVAVVTQNDKPGNRNKLTPPPVKVLAECLGIKVYQYDKISREGVDDMLALGADIMVTCAFGQILSQEVLNICPHGVINIHASLLPKYRGSSPIQWAVINGDTHSGVTIMQTAKAVDSGDVISTQSLPIASDQTCGGLFSQLSDLGAGMIVGVLDDIECGRAKFLPQDASKATHCRMLTKQDGRINFSMSVHQIDCFVRGMSPWPSAFIEVDGQTIKVFNVQKIGGKCGYCGQIVDADPISGLVVACGDGAVEIVEMQVAGGKRMSAKEYLKGHKITAKAVGGIANE